jgi:shikimate kinase
MKKRNIALIGFMGAGKSSVARQLAQHFKRELISTDSLIESREKRSIPQIFQDSGENYFRQLEKKIVYEISQLENKVIDCGGGVILDPENTVSLKKNSLLIYLWASPEYLYENIKKSGGKRPLLDVPDPLEKIKELLKHREPYYKQADIMINADQKTVPEIFDDILKVIE